MHTQEPVGSATLSGCRRVVDALQERCTLLRRLHPVSILDLSADESATIEIARWARTLERKTRIMTLKWAETKRRNAFADYPEVMVAKGALPGMHFSEKSFDFIVAVDMLGGLPAKSQAQVIREAVTTALRSVVFVESRYDEPILLERLVQSSGRRRSVTFLAGSYLVVID